MAAAQPASLPRSSAAHSLPSGSCVRERRLHLAACCVALRGSAEEGLETRQRRRMPRAARQNDDLMARLRTIVLLFAAFCAMCARGQQALCACERCRSAPRARRMP